MNNKQIKSEQEFINSQQFKPTEEPYAMLNKPGNVIEIMYFIDSLLYKICYPMDSFTVFEALDLFNNKIAKQKTKLDKLKAKKIPDTTKIRISCEMWKAFTRRNLHR